MSILFSERDVLCASSETAVSSAEGETVLNRSNDF